MASICRNRQTLLNELAVSANAQETALNTEQSTDTVMLIQTTDFLTLDPRRENNADEANGLEEANTVYDLGYLVSGNFNFNRGQAQHFAFIGAYGLGSIVTSTTVGSQVFAHTITPISGFVGCDYSNPLFTAVQKYGEILKRRFASCFVKSFTVTMEKDDWASIAAVIGGTGKFTNNYTKISVTAAENATALTLAAGGTDYTVNGADSKARLKSVDFIRADLGTALGKSYLTQATVDAASPAIVTLAAVAGTGTDNKVFEVCFIPTEPGWASMPSPVAETPMRTTDFAVIIGGLYYSGDIVGGKTVAGEVKTFVWNYANNGLEAEYTCGGTGTYATRAIRQGRSQTITFNRDFMENMLQQHMEDNDTIGIRALATGALFYTTYAYQVKIIFPQCKLMTPNIAADGTLLVENATIQVLDDATNGSVKMIVVNGVSAYAA